ncbi:hypothetical protein CGCTS75_v011010 [Colletotrichum tropicale]|nr:hypothetical protein CGCTS75_v011010 [Colletotrichum tropicale]
MTTSIRSGAIGKHNVVLACLPYGQMGTNSAAVTATQMSHTFPAIRFGLMVGIGGGCPSLANDIRVGDVVVSKPGRHDGGVVQFDFGRTVANGEFVRNGVLKAPPTVLLNAISVIRATHDSFEHRMIQHLSSFNTTLQKEGYAYQGEENDLLFRSDYEHCEEMATCESCCASAFLIPRFPRSNPAYPRVHYGTIASGNQVIRHGRTRDRICSETGALCVEMEAAGLMNNFPCLLVRGVCDYADTHKNKVWQAYAAAAAAAYTKELRRVVPETTVFVPWSSKIDSSMVTAQDQSEYSLMHLSFPKLHTSNIIKGNAAISKPTTSTPSSRQVHTEIVVGQAAESYVIQ